MRGVRSSMASGDAGDHHLLDDGHGIADEVLPPEELAIHPAVAHRDPISRQHEYARTTLRHSLLQTLAANLRGTQELIALFSRPHLHPPRGRPAARSRDRRGRHFRASS